MERWSGGEVEWWSDGVVEWSNGGKEKEASIEVITPTLHYSVPPFLLAPPCSRTSNFPQKITFCGHDLMTDPMTDRFQIRP